MKRPMVNALVGSALLLITLAPCAGFAAPEPAAAPPPVEAAVKIAVPVVRPRFAAQQQGGGKAAPVASIGGHVPGIFAYPINYLASPLSRGMVYPYPNLYAVPKDAVKPPASDSSK